MLDAKTVRPFVIAAIPSCLDKGLQLSGITSVELAFALWSLTAILLAWALYHPVLEWQNRIRWLTSRRLQMVLSGLAAGAIGLLAHFMFSPADLSLAPTVLRITKTEPNFRDPKTGEPFFINLYMIADGEKSLVDMGLKTESVVRPASLSRDDLEVYFERMHRDIKNTPPKFFSQLNPHDSKFTSIDVPYFTDDKLDAVGQGQKYLYILATWRYRLQGSNLFYVRYYCAYYSGTFHHTNACAGNYDLTFIE